MPRFILSKAGTVSGLPSHPFPLKKRESVTWWMSSAAAKPACLLTGNSVFTIQRSSARRLPSLAMNGASQPGSEFRLAEFPPVAAVSLTVVVLASTRALRGSSSSDDEVGLGSLGVETGVGAIA